MRLNARAVLIALLSAVHIHAYNSERDDWCVQVADAHCGNTKEHEDTQGWRIEYKRCLSSYWRSLVSSFLPPISVLIPRLGATATRDACRTDTPRSRTWAHTVSILARRRTCPQTCAESTTEQRGTVLRQASGRRPSRFFGKPTHLPINKKQSTTGGKLPRLFQSLH
ncbi:hypothetical protein V8E36_006764 [Tilletia maclaganii]